MNNPTLEQAIGRQQSVLTKYLVADLGFRNAENGDDADALYSIADEAWADFVSISPDSPQECVEYTLVAALLMDGLESEQKHAIIEQSLPFVCAEVVAWVEVRTGIKSA